MSTLKHLIITHLCLILSCCAQLRPQNGFGQSSIPASERQFRVVYEWNVIDFAFTSDKERMNAVYGGDYIPQNNLISDIKPYANRLYVSLPRMMPGVPATLGWIIAPENNGRTDPEVEPFPSWEMNQLGNCSALQFVQGIEIDARGVMWVVDSGKTDTLSPERNRFSCPPKVVLIDLKRNGQVIMRHEFSNEVATHGNNYLNKIVVDDADGGYAYITDNSGVDPGIVVFSRRLNRSWKVRESNSMRAALNAVSFAVNGSNLNFSIHIDGIALGPYYSILAGGAEIERNVYYSPLSSYHLYSIPATLLRDPEFSRRATPRQIFQAVTDYGVKMSQTDGMIMDNLGILYFGLLKEHALAQWDSYKPFTFENQPIIAKDEMHIQWSDGMGFDENGNLYVVINRLHNFVAGRLNMNEINFRILKSKTGTMSYVHTGRDEVPPGGLLIPEPTISIITNNDLGSSPSSTPVYSAGIFGGSTRLPFTSSANKNSFTMTSIGFLTLILYLWAK